MYRRYLENVPSIVPLLEKEYRHAARRLEDTQDELNDLHPDKSAPHHCLPPICSPEAGACSALTYVMVFVPYADLQQKPDQRSLPLLI